MPLELQSPGSARLGAPSTARPGLVDRFGRVARDLRVSLTDRCNLRCSYCMPPEGLDWLPSEATLTDGEVVRLVRIGVEELGIRQVRFTGDHRGLRGAGDRPGAGPRPRDDDERAGAGQARPLAEGSGAGAREHLPRFPGPRAFRRDHPP